MVSDGTTVPFLASLAGYDAVTNHARVASDEVIRLSVPFLPMRLVRVVLTAASLPSCTSYVTAYAALPEPV